MSIIKTFIGYQSFRFVFYIMAYQTSCLIFFLSTVKGKHNLKVFCDIYLLMFTNSYIFLIYLPLTMDDNSACKSINVKTVIDKQRIAVAANMEGLSS